MVLFFFDNLTKSRKMWRTTTTSQGQVPGRKPTGTGTKNVPDRATMPCALETLVFPYIAHVTQNNTTPPCIHTKERRNEMAINWMYNMDVTIIAR